MKNKQVIKLIVSLLLVVPFRLSISILFIKLFIWSATTSDGMLPSNIVKNNVIFSKLVYDLIFCTIAVINAFKFFRKLFPDVESDYRGNEMSVNPDAAGMTIVAGIILFSFIIFDLVTTNDLFYHLIK